MGMCEKVNVANTVFDGWKYSILGRSRPPKKFAETILREVRNSFLCIQAEKEGEEAIIGL
jgi:tRNA(Ile)-lysidine synthase TilS/MesJ